MLQSDFPTNTKFTVALKRYPILASLSIVLMGNPSPKNKIDTGTKAEICDIIACFSFFYRILFKVKVLMCINI